MITESYRHRPNRRRALPVPAAAQVPAFPDLPANGLRITVGEFFPGFIRIYQVLGTPGAPIRLAVDARGPVSLGAADGYTAPEFYWSNFGTYDTTLSAAGIIQVSATGGPSNTYAYSDHGATVHRTA